MAKPPSSSQPRRRGRGFRPAGALIAPQMRSASARRGFALARLRALWGDVVGAETARLCAPVQLSARPGGGVLRLSVAGVHAPLVQMMIPDIVARINAALGPGTVARIQLVHGKAGAAPSAPPPDTPAKPAFPGDLPAEFGAPLAGIVNEEYRKALEALARNVLSRSRANRDSET